MQPTNNGTVKILTAKDCIVPIDGVVTTLTPEDHIIQLVSMGLSKEQIIELVNRVVGATTYSCVEEGKQ